MDIIRFQIRNGTTRPGNLIAYSGGLIFTGEYHRIIQTILVKSQRHLGSRDLESLNANRSSQVQCSAVSANDLKMAALT
ncbi:hypothetical protein BofuT4_P137180.1 [Botrytis cinerea T4]|uniref:Uncharacterized protein n=1 Tax=Botryotinia fuckeliana (strain T4) TaxID=999810 RepID=G2YPX5_BOTF4|nr:hypothetical protein BofuT4_P137180.1 [Botrytis cinerea T4]